MPRGDGTGPMGFGPMTGRAAGYCAGYPVPGFMNTVGGRGNSGCIPLGMGFGRGRGRGWGRRNRYYATGQPGWARAGWAPVEGTPPYMGYGAYGAPQMPQMTSEQELDMLKAQTEQFKGALDEIQKRIGELEPAEKQK